MHEMIKQMWLYYVKIWHSRNGKLHGHNFEESKQKALAMKRQDAQALYASSKGNITDKEGMAPACTDADCKHLELDEKP